MGLQIFAFTFKKNINFRENLGTSLLKNYKHTRLNSAWNYFTKITRNTYKFYENSHLMWRDLATLKCSHGVFPPCEELSVSTSRDPRARSRVSSKNDVSVGGFHESQSGYCLIAECGSIQRRQLEAKKNGQKTRSSPSGSVTRIVITQGTQAPLPRRARSTEASCGLLARRLQGRGAASLRCDLHSLFLLGIRVERDFDSVDLWMWENVGVRWPYDGARKVRLRRIRRATVLEESLN